MYILIYTYICTYITVKNNNNNLQQNSISICYIRQDITFENTLMIDKMHGGNSTV